MTTREQLILYVCLATFVIVVFIAIILVRRHGHTLETSKIRGDIAGLRQQMDAEHQALQGDLRTTKGWVLRILNRFGFLQDRE